MSGQTPEMEKNHVPPSRRLLQISVQKDVELIGTVSKRYRNFKEKRSANPFHPQKKQLPQQPHPRREQSEVSIVSQKKLLIIFIFVVFQQKK